METVQHKSYNIIARFAGLPLKSVGEAIFYLSVALSFLGPSFLVIRMGPVSLFPFRIALIGIVGLLLADFLLGRDISIKLARDSFYLLTFLVTWLVWAAITIPFTMDVRLALETTAYLVVGTLFVLLTLYYVRTPQRLKALVAIWAFTCMALLPLGIYENRTGKHLPVSGVYGSSNPKVVFMPTATYRNPNDFATAIALTLPLFFLLTFSARVRARNIVWPLSAVAGVYVVLLTGSRANILAIAAEIVIMALFISLKPRDEKRALFALTIAVLLGISLFIFPDVVNNAIGSAVKELATDFTQPGSSINIRVNLIRNSLHFLAATGGLGVGAGNAEAWVRSRALYNTFGIINPHNWWVEVLVEFGIVIFFLYLAFLAGILWNLLKIAFSRNAVSDVAFSLAVSLFGFAFASISSSSIIALPIHWLLYATCLACVNVSLLEDASST